MPADELESTSSEALREIPGEKRSTPLDYDQRQHITLIVCRLIVVKVLVIGACENLTRASNWARLSVD
jgi:hypothetical protein